MKPLTLLLGLLLALGLQAQQTDTLYNGFVKYYYPSGVVSSEGTLVNGKPDGYWKTYFENGALKSEGNRQNFELDGLWKFYNDSSRLTLTIEYKNNRKNGLRTTFRPGETIAETFVNDVKEGPTTTYYPEGKVKLVVNFVNGLETGFAKEYGHDGTVITLYEYNKGVMVSRERINRRDSKGLKQGKWKTFFDNGLVKTDGVYKDDKRNGYFKEYDETGQLLWVKKFIDDVEQIEVPELTSLSLVTDYYPSGKVKTVGSYNGNVPEGIRREYSEEGTITASYVFNKGNMVGEGIIDEEGIKDGMWKEYYPEGQLRSVGKYDKGKKVGDWKYYYENGKVEEEGRYNKSGKADGAWHWYYEDGTLRREESYLAGLEDGEYLEYSDSAQLIVKGNYIEGLEDGEWTYTYDDFRETGTYRAGARNGMWKSFYTDGTPRFEGSYVDDNLNGKVTWYWPNGKKKDEGNYQNGSRDGDWNIYNEDGSLFMTISYKNDVEKRYDGVLIKPPFEE